MRTRAAVPLPARGTRPRIAVSLHDIEPATFARCALIRDWLDDHGVDRVTLLVIPARDLHPLAERSPELRSWLVERSAAGDEIAQHGFQHERTSRGRFPTSRARRDRAPEFVGMSVEEARRAIDAGWRLLKLAGLEPSGFVAPGYAYTRALRRSIPRRFRWWADRLRLYPAQSPLAPAPRTDAAVTRVLAPAWGVSSEDHVRRAVSPLAVRASSLLGARTLRLEVHPSDLDHPRHMLALEWVLRRAGQRRDAITYQDLLPGESAREATPQAGAVVHPLRVP